MNTDYMKSIPSGGFNYDNCIRNKALLESASLGENKLSFMKTGTTICGVVFDVSIIKFGFKYHNYFLYRKVLFLLLIPELRVAQPLETRIAKRSIIWLLIFIVQVRELQLIVTTLLKWLRESSKCIDWTLILKIEFKWPQADSLTM